MRRKLSKSIVSIKKIIQQNSTILLMINSTLGGGGGTKDNFNKTAINLIKYAPNKDKGI